MPPPRSAAGLRFHCAEGVVLVRRRHATATVRPATAATGLLTMYGRVSLTRNPLASALPPKSVSAYLFETELPIDPEDQVEQRAGAQRHNHAYGDVEKSHHRERQYKVKHE